MTQDGHLRRTVAGLRMPVIWAAFAAMVFLRLPAATAQIGLAGIPDAVTEHEEANDANLARTARITASSEAAETTPGNLNDGDLSTHWAPKDGETPSESWVKLKWPSAIEFQEMAIRQEDAHLSAVRIEIRDAAGRWQPLRDIGGAQQIPRVILLQFPVRHASGIRLSHFAGNLSLSEIEVYQHKHAPIIVLASDLLDHIVGIVTDAFGAQPFANIPVQLRGTAGGKPWHSSAQTGSNGMFQIDLPVGLEGVLTASAHLPDGETLSQTADAGDFNPGLSRPDEIAPSITLEGLWRFQPDPGPGFYEPSIPDKGWKTIEVPGHWAMQGFESRSGTGAYRLHLRIPATFRGRRIKLVFEGVYSGAEVWLNGIRIGSHQGGFEPFELDITRAARVGQDNLLALLVREKTASSHFDKMSYYADFPLTGIIRPIRLMSLPDVHIRRFHVRTVFDPEYRNAVLTLDLSIENESNRDASAVHVSFTLKDPAGHSVALSNDRLDLDLAPWSRIEKRVQFHVMAPRHWEAEHPRLYLLTAQISGSPQPETASRNVGFREIEIRGTQLLVNGVPVKLRGVNYLDANPLKGRVVSPELVRHDLERMKEANLDAIRTTLFPAVENLYDDADKMGFYIEAEGPFCWVRESSDLRYMPLFVQRTAEMLDRDESHPGIIDWSVANESNWGPDFEAAYQFVKQHDPGRPVSAGQSATLELETLHNPITLARMADAANDPMPIIWDESFCVFQGIWGDARELWLDPGDRDYYIEPLIPIWDAVQSSKNVQGGMIWTWADDIFLVPGRDSEYGRGSVVRPLHALDSIYRMPGRGIVGDAPWGIVDGWRRKKPEFWHIKMLMSPIHFTERDLPAWKPGEPAVLSVENRYEFTNLSELSLEWFVAQQHGTLHPELAPHSTGKISIPLGLKVRAGDSLLLNFVDSKGGLVISHRMQLGIVPKQVSHPAPKTLRLRYAHEGFWLGGPIERFIGDNFEISFDGSNGRIRRALIGHRSVLYYTPKLHIQPIEATLDEFPPAESWRLTRPLEIRVAGNGYEVIETGTYKGFAGNLHYLVTPDAGLHVKYDFTFTGQDTRAREIGLQFGVPLSCDKLEWQRRGEWTVYPPDHIGRNNGIAMAHSSTPQTVPPAQPYALDDTPLGTNDFRSTKRNLVYASLTDKDGYGIGIQAIGAQSLRATVMPDSIEVNIDDWFGGTAAVAYGEWWRNYGRGQELRSDDPNNGVAHDRISGEMQLQLLSPANSESWRDWVKDPSIH